MKALRVRRAVQIAFGVDDLDMNGASRERCKVIPRHVAMALMREFNPNITLSEIGRALGNRDHTTVINGLSRYESRWRLDEAVSERVNVARAILNQE